MQTPTQAEVLKTLMSMGEIYGRVMSEGAAKIFVDDLSAFSPDAVLAALKKCRKEIPRFPTVAEIISRAEALDGRPGTEEAWALVPKDEFGSAVITDEISEAMGPALRMLADGDAVGARMTFKELYTKAVEIARANHRPVRWTPTLGFEKTARDAALADAVSKNRIGISHAASAGLLEKKPDQLALDSPEQTTDAARVREMIAEITRKIGSEHPQE